ncbi:hypothetical protein B0H13DRAFT_1855408 [Mycena leptocephala]|nr:hypothetical protein B0H13DRAFT_1855408 [Mycena leptocephala]
MFPAFFVYYRQSFERWACESRGQNRVPDGRIVANGRAPRSIEFPLPPGQESEDSEYVRRQGQEHTARNRRRAGSGRGSAIDRVPWKEAGRKDKNMLQGFCVKADSNLNLRLPDVARLSHRPRDGITAARRLELKKKRVKNRRQRETACMRPTGADGGGRRTRMKEKELTVKASACRRIRRKKQTPAPQVAVLVVSCRSNEETLKIKISSVVTHYSYWTFHYPDWMAWWFYLESNRLYSNLATYIGDACEVTSWSRMAEKVYHIYVPRSKNSPLLPE